MSLVAAPPDMEILRVVESAYRAFGERDVDALIGLLSPDVEWGEPDNPLIPSAGTRHGIPGVLDWLRIGNDTEAIVALEPRRFLADGDTVAVIGWTRVLARPTSRAYETDFVHVVEVRDGRIVRFREFFDTFTAAEAFRPSVVTCRAEWHATNGRSTLPSRPHASHAHGETEAHR